MSEGCTHDCSTCSSNCSERKEESLIKRPHDLSDIKKVYGVVSGKGGVGKSMVTSQLAVMMNRKGYRTAVLDADITGPSIPMAFGLHENAMSDGNGIYPVRTETGIDVMSINLLLKNETDPVIWRGPVIAGAVTQFWTDVIWSDVDYMFVDMPPGTGDVVLTTFQSIPLDGIIIVTSPSELVSMIVSKAVNMAKMMNIPIVGIVENMSYIECSDCGKKISVFGEGKTEAAAKEHGIETICKLPIDPALAALCDSGKIESFEGNWLEEIAEKL